jgi:hypothetical protein
VKAWDFVHYCVVVPYNYLAPRVKKPPRGGFYDDEVLNAFIVLYIFGYIYGFFIKQSIKNKYCNRGRDEEHDCTESDPDQTILLSKRQLRKKRQLYRRCKSYYDSEYKSFSTKANPRQKKAFQTFLFSQVEYLLLWIIVPTRMFVV